MSIRLVSDLKPGDASWKRLRSSSVPPDDDDDDDDERTLLSWNIPKVSSVGVSEHQKRLNFHYPSHSREKKVFMQTNGTDRIQTYSPKECLLGSQLSTQQISTTPNGNPKPEKNEFRKFVSSILSDVEKSAEFNGELISQIWSKMAKISSENLV